MTSQGSKIDPQTTSGDQKVVPKQYFITDFQQRLTNIETDNITLTLRFTLHTIHVRHETLVKPMVFEGFWYNKPTRNHPKS